MENFVLMLVVALTCVLFVVTCRAATEVEGKLTHDFIYFRGRFDRNDGWEIVSHWKRFVRDESVTYKREAQFGRANPLASHYCDALGVRSDLLHLVVEEADLNFTIFENEEFGLRAYFGDQSSLVRPSFRMSVPFVISMIMAFMSSMVTFFMVGMIVTGMIVTGVFVVSLIGL